MPSACMLAHAHELVLATYAMSVWCSVVLCCIVKCVKFVDWCLLSGAS
jgi:hypothetical protein